MARFNPYGNQQLQDSISGIAKALIGNADTDAALARGRASDATAGLRNAQAENERIMSGMRSDLFTKGSALTNDPDFQSSVAKMMNLDTFPANEFGPPAQGQVQLGGDTMSNLARVLLGEYGNAETMSNALGNMVTTGQEVGARNVIMDPNTDLQGLSRAMNLLNHTTGKYLDPTFAGKELTDTLTNNLQKQQLIEQGDLAERKLEEAGEIKQTNLQNTSTENIATADREAENGWKAEIEETKIEIANIEDDRKRQIELDKLKQSQSEQIDKQYIVADGVITMSPALAKRMGVETTTDTNDGSKVFAIDVRPGEGKTPVLLDGGGDDAITIYVDDANLDKLNVQNIDGKPVIPEGALANPAKKSGSVSQNANTILVGENLTQTQEKDLRSELENKIPVSLPDLEESKMAALESYLIRQIDKKVGKPVLDQDGNPTGRNFTLQEVKTSFLNNVLGGGTHIYRKGTNITVPGYFAQRFDIEYSKYKAEPTPAKLKALRNSVKNVYGGMGYSADEVTRILRNFE